MRVTGAGDWLDAELEMDDTELFGNQETAAYNLKSFSFEVSELELNCTRVHLKTGFLFAGVRQSPEHWAVWPGGDGGAGLPLRGFQLLNPRPGH